jgi:TnpA family transposase
MLVNVQHSQPLAALFGAADISSSDGQGFPTAGRGEAVGAINAHYGREASALFYTHVSARHAPYHTVAIPPSGEAAHVIDGLLYHEADLSISVHHTDGGGVSDHVFALAHLLAFRATHPQPCRAPALWLRTDIKLAGAGAVHRRAP